MTSLGQIFLLLLVIAILVHASCRSTKRGPTPVRLESLDEVIALRNASEWACKEIERDDPRWRTVAFLLDYLSLASFAFGAPLSANELELLAPFIDGIIGGQGPPSSWSADYETWNRAVLRGFKDRIRSEGLWAGSN
jgi:hypothetical protein